MRRMRPILFGTADTANLAVIVSEDVPRDISLDELRRVFILKRAFWKPGELIRVVLPGTGLPARAFLLDRVCRKTEGELRRLVLESTYRAEATSPRRWRARRNAFRLVASLSVPSPSSPPTRRSPR